MRNTGTAYLIKNSENVKLRKYSTIRSIDKQVLTFFESNLYKLFDLIRVVGENTHELPQPLSLSIEPVAKKQKYDSENQNEIMDVDTGMDPDYLEDVEEGMF